MTREEAKRIMEIERTCVLRQDTPECGRDEYGCGACDLVQSSDDVIEAYGVAIKALEQSKTGHWIANRAKNYPEWVHCSECGEDWTHDGRPPYCPACGARMRKEK